MTTPTLSATPSAPRTPNSRHRPWLLTAPAVAGIAYSATWLVGLAVWPSNLDVTTTGRAVVTSYTAHQAVAMLQYLLVEGVAAVALAGVVLALGQSARLHGAVRLGRAVLLAGIGAALLSLIQCALGELLVGSVVPSGDAGRAGVLFDLLNRMDGVKMLALAALALAGVALVRRARVLPRWLGVAGVVLAIALVLSGVGYLLLNPTLALAAAVSLALLLVWVTGTAVSIARVSR